MNNEERARFEQEFPVPRNVWWNPEWCGEGRYEWVNVLLQDDSPENAHIQQQRWIGWQAARAQDGGEPVADNWQEFWQKLNPFVGDYIDGYEFRGDWDYTPSEQERFLIDDCVAGLLDELSAEGFLCPLQPSSVVPEWMHGISEGIKTQNNRITADPLFVVFQKRKIVVDEDYDYDRISWGNSDGEADDEVQNQLNAYYDDAESDFWRSDEIEFFDVDTGIEVFRRCALKEVDEFVTACFTEVGANDYLMANGHNLNQPFIFVTSLYRNEEMKRLRGWLMQPPQQEVIGDE